MIGCFCPQLRGAEPEQPAGPVTDGESYLTRLYGRAPHQGLRRTLKKSPYLRLSSPGAPPSRRPRPRVVESVRGQRCLVSRRFSAASCLTVCSPTGVKVKSCKTQTCLAPPPSSPPVRPQPGGAGPALITVAPADSPPVAMAIPLRNVLTMSQFQPGLQRSTTGNDHFRMNESKLCCLSCNMLFSNKC